MLGGSKFLLEFLFCSSEFKPLFIFKTKKLKVQQKMTKKYTAKNFTTRR